MAGVRGRDEGLKRATASDSRSVAIGVAVALSADPASYLARGRSGHIFAGESLVVVFCHHDSISRVRANDPVEVELLVGSIEEAVRLGT
jgi:hypothetical protein